jgi:hypothetical protein
VDTPQRAASKQHVVTVALEDYFQVGAFNQLIQRGQWYRFETRLEQNACKTLDLLDRFQIKATFFVLGWVADRCPENASPPCSAPVTRMPVPPAPRPSTPPSPPSIPSPATKSSRRRSPTWEP